MPERVECYSGVEYAERPIALEWAGRRLEVENVLAQGRTPQGKWFRVRTQAGQEFELIYAELHDVWQVRLLDR